MAAFLLSFTWFLIWSRPVNDFLELQSGRDWGEAGGMLTFLVLGVIGLASIVVPRFFAYGTSTPWTYYSQEHDFVMTLPSRDWREVKMQGSDVAFTNRKRGALVGVNVSRGQEGDYERAVEATRAYFQRASNELQSEPKFAAGVTRFGHPYSYWTVTAKAKKGGSVFLARSFVWCKEKDLIVSVTLEGPLVMQSQLGKGEEQDFFLKSAEAICLSVE